MSYVPIELVQVSLELEETSHAVGRLALVQRKIYFEYDANFLAKGLQLSPVHLPLKSGATFPKSSPFEGLFGLFNDSLPDGWGRLLLDRQVRSYGIASEKLTPLDRLAHVGMHGMGALVYEPSIPHDTSVEQPLRLDQLAADSVKVLEGSEEVVFTELLELSGSSAGARPKVMVGVDRDRKHLLHGQQALPEGYEHWMIKFPSRTDLPDIGAIEFAYSLMAVKAGLDLPTTHLFEAKGSAGYFGVKRFDRNNNQRLHVHSLAGLIHADHQLPSLDYDQWLRATMFLTKSMVEVKKAFRLAAFNVFAHNRDDHAKNFAFLMNSKGHWSLSPAYDLTYSSGPGGEHCTTVAGEGKNPNKEHLLILAEKFGIAKADAESIIDQVRSATADWKRFAAEAGVSKKSTSIISSSLRLRAG